MRTVINWQNENRSFIFKRNADTFLNALLKRGHEIILRYTSIDGTTYITVK